MNRDSFTDSIVIAAAPRAVYDVVSDVTRVGEWSPVCVACEWADGEPGQPGSTFTGHNRSGRHEWSTTSTVVTADPGRAFVWDVNGGLVRWSYELRPDGEGTVLSQTWEFREAAVEVFERKYDEHAGTVMGRRTAEAREGIPASLAAIKSIVEG